MKRIINIFKDPELFSTIIVGSASVLGSFFSYLLQFALGRFLSVEDFGAFNALLSLTYLISVPTTILGTPLVKIVTELAATHSFKKLTALYVKVILVAFGIGSIFFAVLYFMRFIISANFKLNDTVLVTLFGLVAMVNFIGIIIPSFLQGLQRFKAFSFFTVVGSFFRLLIPFGLVFLGLGLRGVYLGFLLTAVVSFTVGYFLLKKNLTQFENTDLTAHYVKIMLFSLPVVLLNFGMAILNNIDSILVKQNFSELEAGYYAGTVTMGKIILFGAGAVTTVMFPKIAALYTQKRPYGNIFRKLLGIQVLAVAAAGGVFAVFPKFFTVLFFKDRFIHSVGYLPLFSLFMCLYVLLNFMTLFLLAIEKKWAFACVAAGAAVQYVMILTLGSDIYQVILASISGTVLSLALVIFYVVSSKNSYEITT